MGVRAPAGLAGRRAEVIPAVGTRVSGLLVTQLLLGGKKANPPKASFLKGKWTYLIACFFSLFGKFKQFIQHTMILTAFWRCGWSSGWPLFVLMCWHFMECSICVCPAVMGGGWGRERGKHIAEPGLLIEESRHWRAGNGDIRARQSKNIFTRSIIIENMYSLVKRILRNIFF